MHILVKLSISCMLVFPCPIDCEERHTFYSVPNREELTGWTYGVFDHRSFSRVRCGLLCLEDQCCEDFLYSASSGRCIGRHFSWLGSTSLSNTVLTTDAGMTLYKKGCETGWLEFKGHCYIEGQDFASWRDAQLECEKMCSHLVEIDSLEENDWLTKTMLRKENCGPDAFLSCTWWTGGNDIQTEGKFLWDHSNTAINFTNWHPLQPSKINPDDARTKDCVDILRTGEWNDRPCSYLNSFVCEKFFG